MSALNCDLSFDPRDPYFPLPGAGEVQWAVQVFTTRNGYGLDEVDRSADPDCSVHGYARLGQQVRVDAGQVVVRIERQGSQWAFSIRAQHSEPIKSVKLILRGLPRSQLAQGWWSPTTPRGRTQAPPFQWNYPSAEWATRWAAAGSVSVGIESDVVSGAVLHVARPAYGAGDEVEIVHAVPASEWAPDVQVPVIRLTLAEQPDEVRSGLTDHLVRVRASFGIPTWEERTDVPVWARELDLVVTLHGQHWTGHVFHTFAQMARRLEDLAGLVAPERVLVYLPGWEGRYYYDYPHYYPSPELGGGDGFAAFVDRAHRLGYRLMPMFGANGANAARYPGWESAAIRNPGNRYPVMLNSPDWDGDRFPEGDQVFLNPGEPVFRAQLVEAVAGMVERFGVDAAFFDTAGFWFDDPRYPLHEGYRLLVAELRERYPGLLLMSEGWWDAMTALFPMSQQWLGVDRDISHPEFLIDVARTTSHLAEGTPGLGSTGVHEQGFRRFRPPPLIAGHLPAISFTEGDGREQFEVIRELLARQLLSGAR